MSIERIIQEFGKPDPAFGPTPFWGLNDGLDPEALRTRLRLFKDRGVAGVFMHGRTGLLVPYLSETWWDRIGTIVEECARLKLKAWIYDEYNWPSGVAGGRALDGRPEFLMPYLERQTVKLGGDESRWPEGVVAAFKVGDTIVNLTEHVRDGRFEPPWELEGEALLLFEDRVIDDTFATKQAPWVSGVTGYLDLMNPEAVEHFMKLTHHEYARRFGQHFGKTIPGVFTDEPQFYRGYPWTGRFREAFKSLKGHDPLEGLYMLHLDRDGYRQFRIDYYDVVERLYAESFYEKLRGFCDEHGLILTGHLGMEERLSQLAVNHGGIYRPLKALTLPGVDALGDGGPLEDGLVNMEVPPFGPRAAAAISRLHADGQVLCESGGGSGWEATPGSLKAQLDWLFASGVTFVNPHQSLQSAAGLRKRDFPPSHGPHEPWFEFYRPFADYVARMSRLVREGAPALEIGYLVPIAALRAASRGRETRLSEEAERTLTPFGSVLEFLIASQRCFELLFEASAEEGRIQTRAGKLLVGGLELTLVVVPPGAVIGAAMAQALAEYLQGGGKAIIFDELPRWDDRGGSAVETLLPAFRRAVEEGRAAQPSAKRGFSRDELDGIIDRLCPPAIKIDPPAREAVAHLLRRRDDADLHFLANLSDDHLELTAHFRTARRGLTLLDPASGETAPWAWAAEGGEGAQVSLRLGPGESRWLVFHDAPDRPVITRSDLRLTEVSAERIVGFTDRSPAVTVGGKEMVIEEDAPPLPLALTPEWRLEPAGMNVLLLEPWLVKCERLPARPLAEAEAERMFTPRTLRLIRHGRRAIKLLELVKPYWKKYRTERYFDFKQADRMQRPMSRVTGIELLRWGLYESSEAMERLGDYLGLTGFMKTFPPAGAEYEATASFAVEHVPDELWLVFEDLGEPIAFRLNGASVGGEPKPVAAWDPACRGLQVSTLVRPGKNRLTMTSRQANYPATAPNVHSLEPVALLGRFLVKGRRLVAPDPSAGPGGDWVLRGYPFYSGVMTYRAELEAPSEFIGYKLVLELGGVRECAELIVNGQSAGVRAWPPFEYEVTPLIRAGKNELEVRVANTGANFFARPRPSGLLGRVRLRPYAVHALKLGLDDE